MQTIAQAEISNPCEFVREISEDDGFVSVIKAPRHFDAGLCLSKRFYKVLHGFQLGLMRKSISRLRHERNDGEGMVCILRHRHLAESLHYIFDTTNPQPSVSAFCKLMSKLISSHTGLCCQMAYFTSPVIRSHMTLSQFITASESPALCEFISPSSRQSMSKLQNASTILNR